jgi:hypothetical protein
MFWELHLFLYLLVRGLDEDFFSIWIPCLVKFRYLLGAVVATTNGSST